MQIFLLDPQLKSIFTNTEDRSYKYAQNIMTVRSDHCRLIDQEEKTSQLKDLLEYFCLVVRTFVYVWFLGAPAKMCRNKADLSLPM